MAWFSLANVNKPCLTPALSPGKIFVAGSIYGGAIFNLKDGKVVQIFIGAAAE